MYKVFEAATKIFSEGNGKVTVYEAIYRAERQVGLVGTLKGQKLDKMVDFVKNKAYHRAKVYYGQK